MSPIALRHRIEDLLVAEYDLNKKRYELQQEVQLAKQQEAANQAELVFLLLLKLQGKHGGVFDATRPASKGTVADVLEGMAKVRFDDLRQTWHVPFANFQSAGVDDFIWLSHFDNAELVSDSPVKLAQNVA